MSTVTVCYQDQIALVVIDNPPLNALNRELMEKISNVFDDIAKSDAGVVVITGAGDRAFVAGADISQFAELNDTAGVEFVRHGQRIFKKIEEFKCPVICAINGYALGGGCELALACDIRVAAENAKLGLPEATLGILPGYGGTQRLPRQIGKGMAKKLIYSGEAISAQEAYRIGLVEVITSTGGALDEAMKLAHRIQQVCAPRSIKEIKQVINAGYGLSLDEGIELEAQAFGRLCVTEDKNEGTAAFFEKRKPVFRGK